LALAAVTEIDFKKAQTIKDFIADPSKFVAASASAKKDEPKKEEKKEESEESDDDMGFAIFD
jgi:large subunit ribosomal protein LP0